MPAIIPIISKITVHTIEFSNASNFAFLLLTFPFVFTYTIGNIK